MVPEYFNEMYLNGAVRPPYAGVEAWTNAMPAALRQMKQAEAEALFRRIGITFAVYGEGGDPDTTRGASRAAADEHQHILEKPGLFPRLADVERREVPADLERGQRAVHDVPQPVGLW